MLRRKFIIIAAVAVFVVVVGVLIISSRQSNNEDPNAPEEVNLEAETISAYREKIDEDLEKAEDPEAKLSPLLSSTTFAIEDNDLNKALEYALEAYELEGLQTNMRFQKGMNLVVVYGERGEFDKGLTIIAEIKQDEEIVSQEGSDIYLNKYEEAYSNNVKPGPLNCAEPQENGECPE